MPPFTPINTKPMIFMTGNSQDASTQSNQTTTTNSAMNSAAEPKTVNTADTTTTTMTSEHATADRDDSAGEDLSCRDADGEAPDLSRLPSDLPPTSKTPSIVDDIIEHGLDAAGPILAPPPLKRVKDHKRPSTNAPTSMHAIWSRVLQVEGDEEGEVNEVRCTACVKHGFQCRRYKKDGSHTRSKSCSFCMITKESCSLSGFMRRSKAPSASPTSAPPNTPTTPTSRKRKASTSSSPSTRRRKAPASQIVIPSDTEKDSDDDIYNDFDEPKKPTPKLRLSVRQPSTAATDTARRLLPPPSTLTHASQANRIAELEKTIESLKSDLHEVAGQTMGQEIRIQELEAENESLKQTNANVRNLTSRLLALEEFHDNFAPLLRRLQQGSNY